MRLPLLCLLLVGFFVASARAAEPFFRKGDVIALVGGEDMVVASEYGYLELLLTRALPDYHLRFRNLAWEGDTVFEQRRDLNFPSLEEQLDKIGATVVICQFGQMESLMGARAPGFPVAGRVGVPPAEPGILPGGLSATTPGVSPEGRSGETPKPAGGTPTLPENPPPGLPEFLAAYEKLIERFSAGGKRRVVMLAPLVSENAPAPTSEITRSLNERTATLTSWTAAVRQLAGKTNAHYPAEAFDQAWFALLGWNDDTGQRTVRGKQELTRDGIHLSENGHQMIARLVGNELEPRAREMDRLFGTGLEGAENSNRQLLALIIAKNRLWFDYWRPQNWAFLAGDRTAQPSSRDHLDPSKRWFPPEREAFLPLIEAKEKEIDALAAQLATGK